MYCRNCGKELSEKAIACPSCGFNPRTEKKFCPECGVDTNKKQVICTKCGVSLSSVEQKSYNNSALCHNRKNNFVAIIFGFLMLISLFLPWISGKYGDSSPINALDSYFNKLVGPFGYICLIASIATIISLFLKFRYVVYLGVMYLLMILLAVYKVLDIMNGFKGIPFDKFFESGIGFILALISVVVFIIVTFKELKGSSSTNVEFDNSIVKANSNLMDSLILFSKSMNFKLGLSSLLVIISMLLFYQKAKIFDFLSFPFIQCILLLYPLFFLKKEKYNSIFNSLLLLPIFYIVNYFVFLFFGNNNVVNIGGGSNRGGGGGLYGINVGNLLEYISSFSFIFFFYIIVMVALILYEKFNNKENLFVHFVRQNNLNKKAYLWLIAGVSVIVAVSFANYPLVSALLLVFPVYFSFKETNKNVFMMALVMPIAYMMNFVIELIDWSIMFNQRTFISQTYSDSIFYAKPVYIVLFVISIIYFIYLKIQGSNVSKFIKKMKLLIILNWLIVCIVFLVPFVVSILNNDTVQSKVTSEIIVAPKACLSVKIDAPLHTQQEETKTLTMTFEGYEEGDLNHLLFKDCETKMDYDFTQSSLNNLSEIPILINNPEAEYGDGYKANPKYLNKKFIVKIKKTKCLEEDENWKNVEVLRWVIISLELKK